MKKFAIFLFTAVVAAITTVFALNTLTASATTTEATVVTVADLVRELKALPQEEEASVSFSTRGMTIKYTYTYVAEDELRAVLAAAEILKPEAYRDFMSALAGEGLTVPDICGWQFSISTMTWIG